MNLAIFSTDFTLEAYFLRVGAPTTKPNISIDFWDKK